MFRTLVLHLITFEDYITSSGNERVWHSTGLHNCIAYWNTIFISLVNKTIARQSGNLYHPILSAKKLLLTSTALCGPHRSSVWATLYTDLSIMFIIHILLIIFLYIFIFTVDKYT